LKPATILKSYALGAPPSPVSRLHKSRK